MFHSLIKEPFTPTNRLIFLGPIECGLSLSNGRSGHLFSVVTHQHTVMQMTGRLSALFHTKCVFNVGSLVCSMLAGLLVEMCF